MRKRIVDLVGPCAQARIQSSERPLGVALGIDGFGDLTHLRGELRIASQIMNELGVGRAEEPFTDGPKPGLAWWPSLLRALEAREQRIEIQAVELLAAIDDEALGKAAVAADALPQDHHAGTVAGRIKCQKERQQPAGEGIGHEGIPGTPRVLARPRAHEFDVEFGMIDVRNVPRTVAVPRRMPLQCQIAGLVLVGSPRYLSAERLLILRPVGDYLRE